MHFHEEDDLGRVYDPQLMRRLLVYARPHAGVLAICLVLLLIVSAGQLLQPYIVKLAIDTELAPGQGSLRGLLTLAGLYMGVLAIDGCVSYVQAILIQGTGQRIVQRIRQDLFDHLQTLSLVFFDKQPVGRLVTRVANDTEALNEMYTSVLVNLFRDVFVIVGTIAVMAHLDWRLTLVGLAVMPFLAFAAFTSQRFVRAAWRIVRVRLARINATLSENLSGMRIIQAFGREDAQLAEFRAINQAHFEASWGQLRVSALMRPIIDFMAQIALAGLLWYGGSRAMGGAIGLGTLYAFTSYLRQFYNPIAEVAEKFNILQSAMASGERIFQLLDTKPEVGDPPAVPTPVILARATGEPVLDPVAVTRAGGSLALEGVWFAYGGENWVLRNLDFTVSPGQTVAFVGHTGAGKSSILNLVARFYDAQRGRVVVDGVEVRNLPQAELRRKLGIVLQEPFLFTGTIAENIRLGDAALFDDLVEAVLLEAGGRHLLETLPDGIQTAVSERGGSLSTGERQIVCFARALARDPAFLILDEATASVDSQTEALIQEALLQRAGQRTTLLVAHRLATVQHADQIVVLHKGSIRQMGTHGQLMGVEGLYRKLWLLQSDQAECVVGTQDPPNRLL